MARIQFTGDTRFADAETARIAQEALGRRTHIYVRPSENSVWLLTEADAPDVLNPAEVTITKVQLLQGALVVGGQPLVAAIEAYISGILSTGTPSQKIHWAYSNAFNRKEVFTNQLRVGIQGALTGAQSLLQMNNIFILGSTYSPQLLP